MGWTPSLLAVFVFANGVVLVVIGLYALRERPDPMAWPLAALTFAGAGWAIPQAINFGYTGETVSLLLQ